jgi:hypothetical protein
MVPALCKYNWTEQRQHHLPQHLPQLGSSDGHMQAAKRNLPTALTLLQRCVICCRGRIVYPNPSAQYSSHAYQCKPAACNYGCNFFNVGDIKSGAVRMFSSNA